MDEGVWILMIMIYTGRHEIMLVPYEEYQSQQVCEIWKGRESKDLGIPLTCVKEGGA